jgi:PAS domain S-box-containing protein
MSDALRESNARFSILTDAMPQMVWSTLPDGFHDYYNARWYEFTGVPAGSTDGEAWNGMFHPEDQDRAWALWRHSLETGEPYEIEYRLRHHSGDYRWTLGRALPVRDASGKITRWIGTCTDIDEQKRTSAQNEILNRELSHRIKNIFAVIGGLIGLSARRDPAVKIFAEDLRGRVAALGRAHEFVRPHSEESRPVLGDVTLKSMLHDLLSAYPAHREGRLRISGDDVALDDRGATPIALVFHELATNAAKYGALSSPDGEVSINIINDGSGMQAVWVESGGPAISGEPVRQGFGTRLTDMSVLQQLGGQLRRDWLPRGLRVTINVELRRLVRL